MPTAPAAMGCQAVRTLSLFPLAKYPEPCVHAKEGVACYVGARGMYNG